jgi:hypothetical protein
MHAQALSERAQVHQRVVTERRARVLRHPDNAHVQRHRPSFPVATRSCPGPDRACCPNRIHRSHRSDRDLIVSTGAVTVSSPTSLVLIHLAPRVRYFSIPHLGRRSTLPQPARATSASAPRCRVAAERWTPSIAPPRGARLGSPLPRHRRPPEADAAPSAAPPTVFFNDHRVPPWIGCSDPPPSPPELPQVPRRHGAPPRPLNQPPSTTADSHHHHSSSFLVGVFLLWVPPIIWLVAFSAKSLKAGFASPITNREVVDSWHCCGHGHWHCRFHHCH